MLKIKLGRQHFEHVGIEKRGSSLWRTNPFVITHEGEELKIYVERTGNSVYLLFDGMEFRVQRPDPIARSNAPAL